MVAWTRISEDARSVEHMSGLSIVAVLESKIVTEIGRECTFMCDAWYVFSLAVWC